MKYGKKKMQKMPGGGRLYDYMMAGGKLRGYKMGEDGMEVEGDKKETRKRTKTPRAGIDYTNDRQAIAAGVKVDYSDPFRNLDDRDTAFMKEALGFGDKDATIKVGGKKDLAGGFYSPQSVKNMRKALIKMKLGAQGKTSSGSKIGGMPTVALTRPFGMEDKPEVKEEGQTIPVKDGKTRGVFPGRGEEPREEAKKTLRSIRLDEK